ncbi:MAG: FtsX-like permease family protein [Bacteroidales bacterium]
MENVENEYYERFKGGKNMIRHLLKLTWNRKKKNFILGIEILISFMVLFAVFSVGVDFFINYIKDRGFEYEKVYSVNLDWQNESNKVIQQKKEQIISLLSQYTEIENFSFATNNVPYSNSQWTTGFKYGSGEIHADIFYTDDMFLDVLEIKPTSGSKFSKEFDANKLVPVIINRKFAEELADNKPTIGKKIMEGGPEDSKKEYLVVGTFEHYKYQNDFTETENQVFVRTNRLDTVTNLSTILLKMKTATSAVFEQKLVSDLSKISPNWTFDVTLLKENRASVNREVLAPFLIFTIVAGFLIFNVALGIFGVLWYSINRRRPEIGLRRAMGATSALIKKQFIGEMWMLTSLSLVIGIVLAVQFPLIGVFNVKPMIYVQSIVLSVLFIFLLVTLCAYKPSSMAAKMQPADTLREE